MSTIVSRLDRALQALQGQGLSPVTILLGADDYDALSELSDWPVTRTARGEIRYRSIAVFKARDGEAGALVGRGLNGATHRIAFQGEDTTAMAGSAASQPK